MVVAVISVRMVQMTSDQVVDVIPVRDHVVPTIGAVLVRRAMLPAGVLGSAAFGVDVADLEHVLVDVVAVQVMQMTVVQVVEMIVVFDRSMPAGRPVLMIVAGVNGVLRIAHTRHHKLDEGRRPADADEKHPQLTATPELRPAGTIHPDARSSVFGRTARSRDTAIIVAATATRQSAELRGGTNQRLLHAD